MTRILAYRFSAFGDVAMTVPVFKEFLEQNPGVEIVMVSRKNFEALFAGIPNVIFKGINVDDYKGFFGLRKLGDELIKEFKPDYIANLHDVIRTKILDRIYRRKGLKVFKIDKGKEEKEHLTDVWNLNKVQLKKTVERYADVFREMGFKVELSQKLRPVSEHKSELVLRLSHSTKERCFRWRNHLNWQGCWLKNIQYTSLEAGKRKQKPLNPGKVKSLIPKVFPEN